MTCFKPRNLNCCSSPSIVFYSTLRGATGATGPAGPAGAVGKGLQIDGSVDDVKDLPPTPTNGTAYFVGNSDRRQLYVYDDNKKQWVNEGNLQGEKGEKGDRGEKGDKGDKGDPANPELLAVREMYFATLQDPSLATTDEGYKVASGERIPIKTFQATSSRISVARLDSDNNIITFTEKGTYEILANFNGYVKQTGDAFDPKTDFVCVGIREVDSDNVYIGTNQFTHLNIPHNITMMGVLQIADETKPYEIVNLQKKDLYLLAGQKDQTLTNSYFTTPLLNLIVKKLN